MIIPNIRYYAKMVYDANGGKTLKYVITAQAGYYQPMEKLVGRDGKISMYLLEKIKEGVNVPSMRLQAKDSLNFTGLKEYFVDGRLSGFAYGYPLADRTYSSKKKENPFFAYKHDGFLFVIHQDKTAQTAPEQIRPTVIELIVLEGAKMLMSSYCKQLMMGGFDEAIQSLREQASRAHAL